MKTKKIIWVLSVSLMTLVMFASCADTPVYSNPDEVSFSSSAAKMVSSSSTWESGDEIGVFMTTTTGVGTSFDFSSVNAPVTYATAFGSTGGSSREHFKPKTVSETLYWSDGSSSAKDFAIFFPASQWADRTGLSNNDDLTINVGGDQTSKLQGNAGNLDFLYGTLKNQTRPVAGGAVELTVDHMLSRIVVKLTVDKSMGDTWTLDAINDIGLRIEGLITSGVFNVSTGTLTQASTPASITANLMKAATTGVDSTGSTDGGIREFEAIVLPATNTYVLDNMKFEFYSLGGSVQMPMPYSWEAAWAKGESYAGNILFEAGKQYTYNIVIKPSEVLLNVTIGAWDTTTSAIDGDAN